MPARTLTIILNANHAKKCVLILKPGDAPIDAILHEARNKFRVKALTQVYLQGGALLEPGTDLAALPWVTKVWVAKGEPYNGPPAAPARSQGVGEVRIIADKTFVDERAVKQLEEVAGLPGVVVAAGMPDLHPGNRFPIGCAVAAEGIYPALIGSDVGCGIALYPLAPPSKSAPNPSKLAAHLRGLDEPWSGSTADWLAHYGITRHSEFDERSLGTVGAGNHFFEITTIERIEDAEAAARLGLQEDALYLLVHTGSRGLGASILAKQTETQANPYIVPDTPAFDAYLAEHDYAVQWAIANRDLVAHRVRECMLGARLDAGKDAAPSPANLAKIVDVTHNSATKQSVDVNGERRELWVHRKGAAPTDKGVAPCPGSRGDFSWLLEPTGDGQLNVHSLAHGAGRRHARHVLHTGTKRAKSTLTTTALGSEVICTDADLLIEEMPEAYKNVGSVVEDMVDKGICKGVVVLRPVVTYKIREAGEGRK
ncbi:release factor H-coupled R [Athelia psychrophila]|uniref:3'-phosphate/5'-hydroxy nucleic acid ligase n=1 Tax=Athelia psychrophila TaxID=1759441 RepID=A0A167V273_9AGAM|nr:release factor H-coupled R [Fibularhizoctonia sp. CBS 109695]